MSGVFSKSNRPKAAGSYFNFTAASAAATVQASVGATVAVGFTHDWGPDGQVVAVDSMAAWQAIYGSSTGTAGYGAVRGAFVGEGLPGYGGAGRVLAYRMCGAAGAKAAVTLQNTTPANAITLTARYKGTRGNALRVTTQNNAVDSAKNDLILLDGTVELERYTYLDADIAALVTAINAESAWITATQVVTGVALGTVSAQAFTGGNDGATLLAADYTAMMALLEAERFGVLAWENLTDGSILTSVKTWAIDLNSRGRRFMVVVGGLANETASTATARGASLNSENFVTVGMGSYRDAVLSATLSTAQLAPRVAGVIAQRGETRSMTFARFAGLTIVSAPTLAEIDTLYAAGVCSLSRDDNTDAPVRLERGVTTYTTTTDTAKPYAIFRTPRYVRVMHALETELSQWGDQNVVGKATVNDATRRFVVGEVKKRLAEREALGAVQPGWTVAIDPNPPATDSDEFVAVQIGLTFGRSAEQVYFSAQVA